MPGTDEAVETSAQGPGVALGQTTRLEARIAARSLKLNRNVRIAAVFPHEIAACFDPLHRGNQAAADEDVRMQLTRDFIDCPRLGLGDVAALEGAASSYDGILITPGRPLDLASVNRRRVGQGTPVHCVAKRPTGSGRISSVVGDGGISGALAAELLSHKLGLESQRPLAI